jgi:hypothetical protein
MPGQDVDIAAADPVAGRSLAYTFHLSVAAHGEPRWPRCTPPWPAGLPSSPANGPAPAWSMFFNRWRIVSCRNESKTVTVGSL